MTALSVTHGEKASGFIPYHPIGFMSVNIPARNSVRLSTDDPFAGDPKLLALDARGYLSYCGLFLGCVGERSYPSLKVLFVWRLGRKPIGIATPSST